MLRVVRTDGSNHGAHRGDERGDGLTDRSRRRSFDAGGAREGIRRGRLQGRLPRRRGGGIILVEVRVAQRAVRTARTRLVRGDVRGYHVVLGAASRQPVFDELFTLFFFDDAHALKPGID